MKTSAHLLLSAVLISALLLGCTDGPLAPALGDGPTAPMSSSQRWLSATDGDVSLAAADQAVVDAMNNGASSGSVIETDVGCVFLPGFADESGPVAFGGLFPNEGGCEKSFVRTNPGGTQDQYLRGDGTFFLLVFDPSRIYGSENSDVQWQVISKEGGISMLTIKGGLSDGSRVRAHFVQDPKGEDNSSEGALWVEGLGYVVAPGR